MFAVIGILMALRAREQSGRGQFVDISMFDGMISAMSTVFVNYLGGGPVPEPMGTAYHPIAPYQVFHAKGGSFGMAVGSEKLWSAFCEAIDRRDLEADPDFATNPKRAVNRLKLEKVLAAHFSQRPVQDCISRLRANGIPCALMQTVPQVLEDQQSSFREMFPVVDHPTAGPRRLVGCPIKLSETPGRVAGPAPLLGEHTRKVLHDVLGLDADAVAQLIENGVALEPEPNVP
jgi:crotonobetainyl-CoA:carnitine CoA-transferase CaiB-like acyl-CoA transferase